MTGEAGGVAGVLRDGSEDSMLQGTMHRCDTMLRLWGQVTGLAGRAHLDVLSVLGEAVEHSRLPI